LKIVDRAAGTFTQTLPEAIIMAIRRPATLSISECNWILDLVRSVPPTPWEFTQAKSTLQQFRGRSLDELPHSDLLQVAKALQVISGYREGGVNDTTF
jgi:hypothetical protein